MKKEDKGRLITDLKDKFSRAKTVVMTDYKGMTVAELTELRGLLRRSSAEYSVVKNTLAKIAAKDTGVSLANELFVGPVGMAIGYDDPVLVVKRVLEFTKTNEKLKVTGAVVEGKLCGQQEIKEIAALPGREVLLAMLAGVMQAPATKMAQTLSATVTSFAYALEALKEQKNN